MELKEKIASLGIGIGLAVGAAVFAFFMLGFLFATIAAVLATFLASWLALLFVPSSSLLSRSLLGVLGVGKIKRGTPPVPEQAIREAKLTTEALSADGDDERAHGGAGQAASSSRSGSSSPVPSTTSARNWARRRTSPASCSRSCHSSPAPRRRRLRARGRGRRDDALLRAARARERREAPRRPLVGFRPRLSAEVGHAPRQP